MKQQRGANGWGSTPFAAAYGIKTNQDFLNSDTAQDAALAQLARDAEHQIEPLKQYIGHRFLTADGQYVTVTHAGLFAAIHKQSPDAVNSYFKENGAMILSDTRGRGLGRSRRYDVNITDEIVNGYPVIRLPFVSNDYVFNKAKYMCRPNCTD